MYTIAIYDSMTELIFVYLCYNYILSFLVEYILRKRKEK